MHQTLYFREARHTAHVMRFVPGRNRFEAVCSRSELDTSAVDPTSFTLIKEVAKGGRTKPWCSHCVRNMDELVQQVLLHVLTPAVLENASGKPVLKSKVGSATS